MVAAVLVSLAAAWAQLRAGSSGLVSALASLHPDLKPRRALTEHQQPPSANGSQQPTTPLTLTQPLTQQPTTTLADGSEGVEGTMESLRRRLELSDSELFRVLLDWPSLLSMHYEDTVAPTLSTLELRLNLSVIESKRIVVEAPRVLSCPEELTKRLTQLQHHLHLTDDELKARLLERPTLALPPHRPASAQRTAAARMVEALGEVGGRKRAMRAAVRALVRALPPTAIDMASAAACKRALAVLEGCERIGGESCVVHF